MSYENNNERNNETFFSKRLKAGKIRTYFFDVRSTRSNDYFITLTESKKRFNEGGYERHKIFLYKEDFNKFLKALGETIDFVKTDLMPDFDFDAFNHDTPYEGDENGGTPAADTKTELSEPVLDKEPEETAAHIDPEEQTVVPPADNGKDEEVDKW